jgi:hypothetical protein
MGRRGRAWGSRAVGTAIAAATGDSPIPTLPSVVHDLPDSALWIKRGDRSDPPRVGDGYLPRISPDRQTVRGGD